MRIMYVAGNPAVRRSLLVEREITDLQKVLLSGSGAREIVLLSFPHLQFSDLVGTIADVRPDVLHLAAHGDGRSLVLEGGHGEVELDSHTLTQILSVHRPALIVLNACTSSSMAALLADSGAADHVIGVDAPIGNGNAIIMATTLYSMLARGATIEAAFAAADANLQMGSGQEVGARLYSAPVAQSADRVRLVQRLELLASFEHIDSSLQHKLDKPDRTFRPERPAIRFALTGVPDNALQTIVFCDDEKPATTADPSSGCVLLSGRDRPVDGSVAFKPSLEFYGDAGLHACVTTSDGHIRCTSSTLVSALQRRYFERRRRDELPGLIVEAIEASLDSLRKYGPAHIFP